LFGRHRTSNQQPETRNGFIGTGERMGSAEEREPDARGDAGERSQSAAAASTAVAAALEKNGSAWDPVILLVFKTSERHL
jgi:hypothetical protein